MEEKHKIIMANMLRKLSFVNWDRFTEFPTDMNVFGWIDREDGYKDFVFLSYLPKTEMQWFVSTSSAKFSEDIYKLVYGTLEGHSNCKRVEHSFNIENCVRLKNE